MKTETDRDGVARLSRRAFVVGAGAAVAASTTGTASAADADGDPTFTVEATEPYLPTVSELVDAFEREAEETVHLETYSPDSSPTDRILDGSADVLVSGDPVPAAGEVEEESDVRRGVRVHGWATLATRSAEWRECLPVGALNERSRSARPIETWSESDWETIGTLEDGGDESGGEQCAGLIASGGERTSLVRGTRAYQYAHGQGGDGYYEVESADVGAPSTARARGDGIVPIVRLGYVYAHQSALDRRLPSAFLGFSRRYSPATNAVSVHAEPRFESVDRAARLRTAK